MKKRLALLVAAAPLAMGAEMPTVFGKINKALVYTSQDDTNSRPSTERKTFDGITDVHNSESRMGVKGKSEVAGMKTKYKVSLGINSTKGGDSRIRIREAVVHMKSKYGKITAGQTYTALSKQGKRIDPLEQTIAGHQGDDQKERIANATDDLGFNYRSRKDLIGYTTPSLHGLTYQVTSDRNDKMSNDPENTNYGSTHYEHLLRYQRAMGGMDLDLFAGQNVWSMQGTKDNKNMMYGLNLTHGAMTLGLAMSKYESTNVGDNFANERDRMFAALTYRAGKNKVAFTYQTREDKNAGNVKDDGRDYTQMALGYSHSCSNNVDVNFTVLKYKVEDTTKGATEATKKTTENDATMAALGIQLKF